MSHHKKAGIPEVMVENADCEQLSRILTGFETEGKDTEMKEIMISKWNCI